MRAESSTLWRSWAVRRCGPERARLTRPRRVQQLLLVNSEIQTSLEQVLRALKHEVQENLHENLPFQSIYMTYLTCFQSGDGIFTVTSQKHFKNILRVTPRCPHPDLYEFYQIFLQLFPVETGSSPGHCHGLFSSAVFPTRLENEGRTNYKKSASLYFPAQ